MSLRNIIGQSSNTPLSVSLFDTVLVLFLTNIRREIKALFDTIIQERFDNTNDDYK